MQGEADDRLVSLAGAADVVLIGPGLIDVEETGDLLEAVVHEIDDDTALVVDAYALAALAVRPGLLRGRATWPVLTPNRDEGSRLLDPEGSAWRDETGDTGLGTSGSGDVLAGLVAGLLARGADSAQAASWAAHVHAAAGQLLTVGCGRTGHLAREIVDGIAPALASLEV